MSTIKPKTILVVVFLLLLLNSLHTKEYKNGNLIEITEAIEVEKRFSQKIDTPSWGLTSLQKKGVLYGVGSAKVGKNKSLSLRKATAIAQGNIAEGLSILVEQEFTSRESEELANGVSNYSEFMESVIKTTAKMRLEGVQTVSTYNSTDGYIWVLVAVPTEETKQKISDIVTEQVEAVQKREPSSKVENYNEIRNIALNRIGELENK